MISSAAENSKTDAILKIFKVSLGSALTPILTRIATPSPDYILLLIRSDFKVCTFRINDYNLSFLMWVKIQRQIFKIV